MSELNKPRKFEIFYSGLAGTFSVRNNYSAFIMNIQKRQTDEYIHVIELAPMLKMLDEMARIVSLQLTPEKGEKYYEEYKAFKRENGLEKLK